MNIIGLSGKMKSGKSTVAEYLYENIPNSFELGFSHSLKSLVGDYMSDMTLFGSDFESQKAKESLHPCGKTYRQILQEVGAKLREVDPDVWVREWCRIVRQDSGFDVIIVPDVRFPNEVKAIQDMGGIVIRLTRSSVESDDPTETSLDDFSKFDALVLNDDMTIDYCNETCLKIAQEYLNEPV